MERVVYTRSLLEELIALYRDSVLHVCGRTYTKLDIQDWLDAPIDREAWHSKWEAHKSILLRRDKRIVAFGLMRGDGHLEMLYTHHLYQQQGLSSRILMDLENTISAERFTLVSTENAISFYQKHGYFIYKTAYKKYHTRYFYYYYMMKYKN